ncbi:tripartite motif-containing protein 6-like [Triplophysa dalaica]|uniref:tripartite motif-containing protein 6-like n=1 Tax=Triplophysa dalaica TaxID=1582913 RepID=UPI0024DF5B93|nr:tripartite motif-containing protein 6-like [Triplophysa dalaica]
MATAVDVSRHLQCPICKNLFEDPVSTVCGHSFCQRCLEQHISTSDQQCPLCKESIYTKPSVNVALKTLLQQFLQMQMADLSLYTGERGEIPCNVCEENLTSRAVKSCLTCLLSYCERHLKRHQSLSRHRGHKLVSPVERLDEKACPAHGRPLELYCKREKRLICTLCVKTGEDVISIETERERREAEQQNIIKGLESMTNQSENKLEDLQNTVTKYQVQIDREQREIKEVFAEVMDVVRRAEVELLIPLEDGRRRLDKEMAEKTQQIQKEILKYREIIDHLNQNKKEEDDMVFLQSDWLEVEPSVPAEVKDDWTVSIDTELKFGSMRNINSSALASIRTQLENLCSFEIRRIQRFSVDVILDEETAHLSLEVSQEGKSVRDNGNVHYISGGPGQFDLVGGILGKLQIMSGRAFWVVEVGEKTSWELGVLRENANRKGKVSYKPEEGYWAIVLCDSNLYGAFEDPPLQLHLSTKPQKVGVFVDYEDALVSFYNMDNLSHIYSFTQCDFNETLRPYFNPHPNKDGNNSLPMTICSVNPDDIFI